MRFKTILLLLALSFALPLQAQNTDYPTLEAMANTDISTFSYLETVSRYSSRDTNFSPPTSPPDYQLGDTETFSLRYGEDYTHEKVTMELRALTARVLVWVHDSIDYPRWRAHALAQRIETQALNPMEKLFQFAEPPGVDGDSRLNVVMIHDPDNSVLGYFPPASTRPRSLHAKSNQREMLVVNLALDDEYDFFDKVLIEVIAHEFLHVLHFHADYGEDSWLDEALASYGGYVAGKALFTRHGVHSAAEAFLEVPHVGLTQWQAVEDLSPKYGAGVLFMVYLTERFGDEIAARLLAEQANGWEAVEKVLQESAGVSANEIFADWVLANYFMDARRGYGYRALDADLEPPKPVASYNSFPATHEGSLPQFGSDYIAVDVRGADKLFVRLWQAPDAQFINERPAEGDFFAYALTSDSSNSLLSRTIDLSAQRDAWLEFSVWYNLKKDDEYGFVVISEDNGESWRTLSGRYTTESLIYGAFYDEGYTGRSPGWVPERIDLRDFTPGRIMIGFEVVSNIATSYHGMAIDNLRIRAEDFQDGFESPDDAWVAEGWIRTDNRLPNNTWLQVVQENRDGLQLSRTLVTGNGELTVDLLPGVSRALVAVSPIVPHTSLPTDFELELYLLNAAGEVMVVTRECTVTTTAVLNFRASPNGNKIGLVPDGAVLDALDRQEDWFMVDYNGVQGWISAGYVSTAGKCP